jgi:hypothetical protein
LIKGTTIPKEFSSIIDFMRSDPIIKEILSNIQSNPNCSPKFIFKDDLGSKFVSKKKIDDKYPIWQFIWHGSDEYLRTYKTRMEVIMTEYIGGTLKMENGGPILTIPIEFEKQKQLEEQMELEKIIQRLFDAQDFRQDFEIIKFLGSCYDPRQLSNFLSNFKVSGEHKLKYMAMLYQFNILNDQDIQNMKCEELRILCGQETRLYNRIREHWYLRILDLCKPEKNNLDGFGIVPDVILKWKGFWDSDERVLMRIEQNCQIPIEVFEEIFAYLGDKEACRMQRVCSQFYFAIKRNRSIQLRLFIHELKETLKNDKGTTPEIWTN